MSPDRRQFLSGAAGGVAAASLGAAVSASAQASASIAKPMNAADLSPKALGSFVDRERTRAILAAEGLDALVVAQGRNVFHATQFFPLLERMSLTGTTLAVIPQDPRRPIGLIIPAFSYYYIQADDGAAPDVQPFVFANSDGLRIHRLEGEASPREHQRRQMLAAAAPYSASMVQALAKALDELGIARGRLGCDDNAAAALVAQSAPAATAVAAEDTPRRIRLVRSPGEIQMMRLAASANVEAAHAAIAAVRELGSLGALRQQFYAEAAMRGNLGVFMVVDGSSSDAYDEPLRDGRAFMIDCVSHRRNFHGDYGRTIFLGEPSRRMRYCTDAMSKVWGELQTQLRPGLRFSQVRELGNALLDKFALDVPVAFAPHSVGLAHNDQPRFDTQGRRADIVIEENMILSIDCPLFETGSGGTAHLEDLVLITATGAEALHPVAPAVLSI
jgi:Xaa-Pro aminopeptidase